VDVRVESHPERSDVMVMTLVRGDEELEIESWSTKRYSHGPGAVIRTLGDLRRGLRTEYGPAGAPNETKHLLRPKCG
jgi:hypothetical protein